MTGMNALTKTDIFVMDANNILFTNNKHNPTQSWLVRMISHLSLSDVSMKMHSSLWECISRLYSYGCYYDDTEPFEKNVYFTEYGNNAICRHEAYIDKLALPIVGQWYRVEIDNKVKKTNIEFIVDKRLVGIITNIECQIQQNGCK